MKKKILIVTECFYPEEFKINDIAISWMSRGYSVDVLTLFPTYPIGKVYDGYSNRLFYRDSYNGINIFRLYAITGYKTSIIKKIMKYMNFMILGTMFSVINGYKYNYVFGFNLGSLTDMFPAVVIRKLYNKPVLLWVQDVWPDSVYAYGFKKTKVLSYVLDKFVSFIYNNVTSIAISGRGFEKKIKPYIREDMIFNYLPNWADELDMDLGAVKLSEQEKIHFTFAGNVGKVQNLDTIITSFMELPTLYKKKAQLNIIGDGSSLNDLKRIVATEQSVVFHGKQRRSSMASFYKASDFLIISLIDKPIFSVTVPAKTQTYISAKKPILGIIKGDTADIINDNNLGVCADPTDSKQITRVFSECIDMPEEERNNFIKNNDKLLLTTFNKKYIVNKMLSILTN